MKSNILFILITLTGCTSPKTGRATVSLRATPVAPAELIATVRYPELLKGYHVSRYVDSQNRLLMHEGHPVYRVESSASWNLQPPPPGFIAPTATGSLTNSAFVPAPVDEKVIAELNRQRQITQAFARQSESLNQALEQFRDALAGTRSLAQQNQQLRDQIARASERLTQLEKQLKPPSPSPQPQEP